MKVGSLVEIGAIPGDEVICVRPRLAGFSTPFYKPGTILKVFSSPDGSPLLSFPGETFTSPGFWGVWKIVSHGEINIKELL